MKNTTIITMAALLLGSSGLMAQTTAFTDPSGFTTLSIQAASALDQPAYTYLSTSMALENTYQGVVLSGGSGTITVKNGSWTVNEFASEPFYVVIGSGSREGEMLDIVSNTVDTLALSVGEDQADLADENIKIYKHNTLASIFGEAADAGLIQKGTKQTADNIQLYDSGTGAYETYYYNTAVNNKPVGGVYHQGWVNASNITLNAENTPIYPDDGFIYKRVTTTLLEVVVTGSVITNRIKLPIVEGYNLIAIPYPVDKSISLVSSGLRPTLDADFDINIHLQAGSKKTADQVVVFNVAEGKFETYYYNNVVNNKPVGGVYHQGWVNATDITVDASSVVLPSNTAFFILRQSGAPAFHWNFDSVMN